jgi:hypothetical protein
MPTSPQTPVPFRGLAALALGSALLVPFALGSSALAPAASADPSGGSDGAQEQIQEALEQEVQDQGLEDAAADIGTKSASPQGLGMQTPAPATITNPISSPFADTYADPSILRGRDGWFYAYATSDPLVSGGEFGVMHMARTRDFADWEYLGTVFDEDSTPAWAAEGSYFWAPDVRYVNGEYRMYFTVTDSAEKPGADPGIGMATAPTPAGPWTDSGAPVVESQEIEDAAEVAGIEDVGEEADDAAVEGDDHTVAADDPSYQGLIDPAAFVDEDGSVYLYVGGFAGGPHVTKLNDEGTAMETELQPVAAPDRYEGSYVIKHGDYYYLTLSAANCCAAAGSGYSVFAGRSESPMGPFVDQDGHPLLGSRSGGTQVLAANGNTWVGVGHHAIFSDTTGQDWILYHGIDKEDSWLNNPGGINKRPMLVDKLDWIDGWPVVNAGAGPSEDPVPGPVTGSALGIDTDDPASGKALKRVLGRFESAADEDGDAGQVGALRTKGHVPALSIGREVVSGDARIESDVRLADEDANTSVQLQGLTGNLEVRLDGKDRELRIVQRSVKGKTTTQVTPIPDRVDLTTWHTLVVSTSGDGVRAELQESRLNDPVTSVTSDRTAPTLSLLALTSTKDGADLDNLSVAPLANTPDAVPDPEVGEVTFTEEFDGDLADVEDNGWDLTGEDPGITVADGQLTWPLTDDDIGGETGSGPLLLRDAPEGDWVMETDLTLDTGEDTIRNYQQAGLIVHAHDDLFVRLDSVSLGTQRLVEFFNERDAEGHLDGPTATEMTLRIQRTHNDKGEQLYRSAFSTDGGETWTWGMTWTLPEGTDVRIGLVAGGGADPATDAVFDEFRLREAG